MTAFSPLPSQTKARVAVFIDGDHIPPSSRPSIALEAARLGSVASTQLFCDLSLRSDWAAETGIDTTHCKGRPGKNSADISLCIAALDLAYRGLATAFLIASNDRDFEPLIRHLHRIGCTATQIKMEAPTAHASIPPSTTLPASPRSAKDTRPLLEKVRAAIMAHGGPDGIAIQDLNHAMQRQGIRITDEPEKTWRAWLRARPQHFSCDPKGPQSRVRLVR